MRAFPLALIPLLVACGGAETANNSAATSAQAASEAEASEDVTAAQNAEAAAIAETDAALDDLANEVGEPAQNSTTGNAR